jgi:hypothetical protein
VSKTMDLLHKIDKQSGITGQKVEALGKDLEDYKIGQSKHRVKQDNWEVRIEAAVQECPESSHIKTQNGKISDMQTTLKAIKYLVKWILVIGTVAGIYFGIIQSRAVTKQAKAEVTRMQHVLERNIIEEN